MCFIGEWASNNETPILRSQIISEMVKNGAKDFTVVNSLNSLLKKGYIRKSTIRSNKTSYVQIRKV